MGQFKLEPKIEFLKEEWLLVQAWKKTASYIRSHNWYADVLALDMAAIDLPNFIKELQQRFKEHRKWENKPIRMIPAPKSQEWEIREKNWQPKNSKDTSQKIRPLAYIDLQEQVAAMAISLCFADRLETLMGDPTATYMEKKFWNTHRCISYGNRLFCDEPDCNGVLKHRWGSTKFYRGYFQDYRSFLGRPEFVADTEILKDDCKVIIVQSDLKQFYDRVSEKLFDKSLKALQIEDKNFIKLIKRIFLWNWAKEDEESVKAYEINAGIENFSKIVLPQGLVVSGLISNLILYEFDQALRKLLNKEFFPGFELIDVCRYVDDLRLVLKTSSENTIKLDWVEISTGEKLQKLLNRKANGLHINLEKTKAAFVGEDERPIIRQSRKMERIQKSISGGFDAIEGEEILDTIDGLMRSQARINENKESNALTNLTPVADVGDETVARFAAGRYRKTVRSIRPLLEAAEKNFPETEEKEFYNQQTKTRRELDEDTKCFAFNLIEKWFLNPANIRLLRIGLDLWPSIELLSTVTNAILPIVLSKGSPPAGKKVGFYCLSEIFRAGATETGLVREMDLLPNNTDVQEYRKFLLNTAEDVILKTRGDLPWYLLQQMLLLFAASRSHLKTEFFDKICNSDFVRQDVNQKYLNLIRFIANYDNEISDEDYGVFAVYHRRAIGDCLKAKSCLKNSLDKKRLERIAKLDPEFGLELISEHSDLAKDLDKNLLFELGVTQEKDNRNNLSIQYIAKKLGEKIKSEAFLVRFAIQFLKKLPRLKKGMVLTPLSITFPKEKRKKINPIDMAIKPVKSALGIFSPPSYLKAGERWKFQLGAIIRSILSGKFDFLSNVRPLSWKEKEDAYRVPRSNWFQRYYGSYNGHSAFGDEYLPITEWFESFLFTLLAWPGCLKSVKPEIQKAIDLGKQATIELLQDREKKLKKCRGSATRMDFLPIDMRWPTRDKIKRPFRACIVQTILPKPEDLFKDPLLENKTTRRMQKNHLASALRAVDQMVNFRRSHSEQVYNLDFLILPELSVHPDDVETFLVPFARARKTSILAGLTYDKLEQEDDGLVNSAIWVIPVWNKKLGLQIVKRRQGKKNPADLEEKSLNGKFKPYRPCQWIASYNWKSNEMEPLKITASICYDSTDLDLAADLRKKSDIFIVPALNKDVKTFDHMALALHYHMFQIVVVANNGAYGGSSAHQPKSEYHLKQVFHSHGNNQATISFLEIENIPEFLKRHTTDQRSDSTEEKSDQKEKCPWKTPPAGMRK